MWWYCNLEAGLAKRMQSAKLPSAAAAAEGVSHGTFGSRQGSTAALDAGLISAAQAVEHYEIARYGTLKSWAQQLGLDDAVTLLDATLNEEVVTDQTLTKLGEQSANLKAAA